MKQQTSRGLHLLPIIAAVAAAAIGGSSGLYIKGLAISSLAMSGFRMGVPFLILLPFMAKRRMLTGPPGMRRHLLAAGFLNALRMILYIIAYKLTAMGNAVVLLYLWPVFALLFQSLKDRRMPGGNQMGILGLAFAGVVVMNLHRDFSWGSSDLTGSLCMLMSAAIYSLTAILLKSALKNLREMETVYFQNAFGALVFLPFLFMELPRIPPEHLALGLLYGFLVGFCAFGLFFFALKRLSMFQYGAITYTEVPLALVFSVVVLSEPLTVNLIIGAVMVITASFSAQQIRSR